MKTTIVLLCVAVAFANNEVSFLEDDNAQSLSAFTEAEIAVNPSNPFTRRSSALDGNQNTLSLTLTFRDISHEHPDFEGICCGLWRNQVQPQLGSHGFPVRSPTGFSIQSEKSFDAWWGTNDYDNTPVAAWGAVSQGTLPLTLTKLGDGRTFKYESNGFFPMDNVGNSLQQEPWRPYGHNFFFTVSARAHFYLRGDDSFCFRGDDDVWVYFGSASNQRLLIDLGGVHGPAQQCVSGQAIADQTECEVGQNCHMSFFFAERHTTGSNFMMMTTLPLQDKPPVPEPPVVKRFQLDSNSDDAGCQLWPPNHKFRTVMFALEVEGDMNDYTVSYQRCRIEQTRKLSGNAVDVQVVDSLWGTKKRHLEKSKRNGQQEAAVPGDCVFSEGAVLMRARRPGTMVGDIAPGRQYTVFGRVCWKSHPNICSELQSACMVPHSMAYDGSKPVV